MGMLVDGVWQPKGFGAKTKDGRFIRNDASFRQRITRDGSSGFPATIGRYHLVISHACPWAHRCLIVRHLKGLTDIVSVSVVEPLMLDQGWIFSERRPDGLGGAEKLYELYQKAKPDYTGRVTVPVLWDKERATIVSNESSEILRMFNVAFADTVGDRLDLYPADLRVEIDELNARVYDTVNNGVYKSGFASTQEAYEEAVTALFDTLDWLEDRLRSQRTDYLFGDQITEADVRLFTTLVRFDSVYVTHFKCNIRRLVDYPNLWSFTRRIYQLPGISDLVHLDEIKLHYFASHSSINPTGIIPKGPAIDWSI